MENLPESIKELVKLLNTPLFRNGRVVLFLIDKNLSVKAISPNIKKILGYSSEDFIFGKVNFSDIIDKEDREKLRKNIEMIDESKIITYIGSLRLKSSDGKTVWVSCRKVHIPDKKTPLFLGYMFDKTKEVEERSLFETISKVAPIGIFLQHSGKLIFVNKKIAEITEYTEEELLSMDSFIPIIHPEDRDKVKEIMELRNKGIKKFASYRIKITTKHKKTKWIHINSDTVFYKGKYSGIGTLEDITKDVHLERAKELLFRVNKLIMKINDIDVLLKTIAETISNITDFSFSFIAEVDNKGRIIPKYFSEQKDIIEKLGLPHNRKLPEYDVLKKNDYLYIKDINQLEYQKIWIKELSSQGVKSVLALPIFIHDEMKYILFIYAREREFFFKEEISIYREISDDIAFAVKYIEQQENLFKKEFYDALTGLGNRKLLLSKLHELVIKNQEFYLVSIDLYNFGYINETYGDKVGDLLLKEVSVALKDFLSGYEIFRSSSDTFSVIVKDKDIISPLERIRLAFAIPFSVEDHIIQLDFNVSVVKFPEDGKSETDIYMKGERTLEFSKNKGKNQILFYNERDYQRVKTIKELEEKIDIALMKNQFSLKLQPVVDFKTDEVVGVEALIRWIDENGNYIPPLEFIPVAEKTGQIKEIDNLMLLKANELINTWKAQGLKPVKISVNVTPRNIEDIIYRIRSINKMVFFKVPEGELLLNSKYIIMEITERDLLELNKQKKDIDNLREMGFEISIDDFGTGFSTLRYLANINIDYLKIDMIFIKDMLNDKNVYKLVQSIINIAKIFNIKTIAEGVETKEQYEELKKLGCDRYQGYYFSPPLDPEEFTKYLKK
ncbi:EAL domain-containing protein [Persephonella sp.]